MLARPPLAHPGSHAPRPKKGRSTVHDAEWLRARYVDEQMTLDAIAALVPCSKQTVVWHMKKHGIERRDASSAKKGRPSGRVMTPEMSASFSAAQRESWKTRDRVSKRRGDNYDPDPRMAQVKKVRAHRTGVRGSLYDEMLAAQAGLCEICGNPETRTHHRTGTAMTLAVDHHHGTGKVRALLCNRCNIALGYVKEDTDLLRRMIAYLEAHTA
jgi:hypothetical protein